MSPRRIFSRAARHVTKQNMKRILRRKTLQSKSLKFTKPQAKVTNLISKADKLAIAVTAAFLCGQALAAPPEGANPNFAPYFKSLRLPTPGSGWMGYCCTEADCREVDTRNNGGTMEVFIDKKTFGPDSNAPDDWVPVPKNRYAIPDQDGLSRPVRAVACWYQGQLRCFDFPLTQG